MWKEKKVRRWKDGKVKKWKDRKEGWMVEDVTVEM
jgi:hypothetical protein